MNHEIASILKNLLTGLPFVDKISGLVQTVFMDIVDKQGNKVNKSFPVSCDIDFGACDAGSYLDLCPDDTKKSVIYFEDRGVVRMERRKNHIFFRSSLRLVCWLNTAKINENDCQDCEDCSIASSVIGQILCALPEHPENLGSFYQVFPQILSEDIRSSNIFSAYTYSEKQTQYLMCPFDYFALNIETTFAVCVGDCV